MAAVPEKPAVPRPERFDRSKLQPSKNVPMKQLLMTILSAGLLAFGGTTAFAQTKKEEKKAKKAQGSQTASASSEAKPKTVMHVITVAFKPDAKPEQIQAAMDGAHKLTTTYPGVLRVWTKTIKAQGNRTHAIVMEFKDEQALKDYAGSAAQTEWYKVYEDVRDASTTFDITN
jgi:hypothetical protein